MVTRHLTLEEAAKLTGSTVKGLRGRLARGKFPYKKMGRRILIPEDELEKFMGSLPGCTAAQAVNATESAR